ncbi:hypothetical protein GGR54DRAFT_646783 [Hypoxylon sp. NC1633]|nr:hypothetical protein GGR54DRAFT_646783 [Hypoxylon sp. NC1633]
MAAADESYEYSLGDDSEESFRDEEESDEEERPNRWRGPKSTWQQLNSEEIDTFTALKKIRDRDLSIHLYNAFKLKQRHQKTEDRLAVKGPSAGKDINVATGQPVQPDDWLPQQSWTAWPMRVGKVPSPQDDASTRFNDPDERYTLRKPVQDMPSTVLEEIIGAHILKTAKEKFNSRPWDKPDKSSGEEDEDSEVQSKDSDRETTASASTSAKKSKSGSRSRSRSKSAKREYHSEDERMDVDPKDSQPIGDEREEPSKKRRLIPVITTDDDLSYSLLRPSVRHILSKLDATLSILHNVQESLNYQSDSAGSEATESSRHSGRRSSSRQSSRTPTSTTRGRPRGSKSRTQARGRSRANERTAPSLEKGSQPDGNEQKGLASAKPRMGRPKKTYPRLEDETDREFAIRIARLRKRPIPVFPDDDAAAAQPYLDLDQDPEPEAHSATEEEEELGREGGHIGDGEEETPGPNPSPHGRTTTTHQKKRKATQSSPSPRPHHASSSVSTTPGSRQRKSSLKTRRLGLRDWRDALGAAALAGFPAQALDRAARRCADLFAHGQQDFALHSLAEGPTASSGRRASHSQSRDRDPRRGWSRATYYGPGMAVPPLLSLPHAGEGDGAGNGDGMHMHEEGGYGDRDGYADERRAPTASDDEDPRRRRSASRPRARSGTGSGTGRSRSRPRSRSRSASAPGSYACAFRDCPRAMAGEGFARRQNLLRHLRLVHSWTPSTASEVGSEGTGAESGVGRVFPAEEVDSEDEMYGAVHVDGFLRRIRMRPGWRGGDAGEEPRRRRGGLGNVRTRGRSWVGGSDADDDGDTRMGGSGYEE